MYYKIIDRELYHPQLGNIIKRQIIYYQLIDSEYIEFTRENYTDNYKIPSDSIELSTE